MDYQRIYDQIIDRAKKEGRLYGKDVYYERHHIIPKCVGGEGKTHQWRTHPNIVLLTAREHFICHQLLCQIYPNESKLKFALWAMSNQKTDNRDYKIGNRQYERMKQEYVKLVKGVPKSEQYKQSLSRSKLGVKKPPMTDTHRINLKQSITGLVKSDTHRKNISKSKSITVYQYDLQGHFIKEWESAKQAGKELKIDSGDIGKCRRGNKKSAGGFIWKSNKTQVIPYRHNNSTQIIQYTLEGNLIQEHTSISEASKTLHINPAGISNCANGYSKTSGGFIWKYKHYQIKL